MSIIKQIVGEEAYNNAPDDNVWEEEKTSQQERVEELQLELFKFLPPTLSKDLPGKQALSNAPLFKDLPTARYSCIVVDPPWFYRLRNKDKSHRNKIPYPPMAIEDILKLPVPDLCSEQGTVLWLWFTNNHMIEAGRCIEEWGFTLKTILTWEKISQSGKTRIGTGHWLRNATEHCVLATKGKVPSFSHLRKLTNQPTILHALRREHSRKPEKFFTLVEGLCEGPRLEMFAREKRPGWDAWGNETEKFECL